ncbi:MAG: hypothetical protein Q8S57_03915 [Methanoregula sp.]|nr:hypothetical protein [Methanoregula sp.]
MKKCFLVFISLILMLCVLIGGCVQSSPPSPATPAPTPSVAFVTPQQTQIPQPPQACSLIPGPIQIVPEYESVSVTVNRNTITENPTIAIVFNGGLGLGMVTKMNVTVIRSDCVREQQNRNNPVMGDTVTLMGTTRTDRVIVVMTMTSGSQYTIIDKDYPFPPQVQ